jgi:uncharacterized Tic20 family protein
MEPIQTPVTHAPDALYVPRDDEMEKASNGYLMSVMAIMVGLPLPIINLLATLIFFLGNIKSSRFVRWHCTQALLSQLTVFLMNSVAFTWTIQIWFGNKIVTDSYIAYLVTIFFFNITELVLNIVAAIRVRKGKHVRWWFWSAVTDIVIPAPVAQSKTAL